MFALLRSFKEHDGTCNVVPGWEVTLNPVGGEDDADCFINPDFDQPGLGSGASFGPGGISDLLPEYATA